MRSIDASSGGAMFEQMLRIGEGDVFIGVTFSRCFKRTLAGARYAKASGARVVAITDSMTALIAAIGMEKSGGIATVYQKLEGIWDEYHVYEKDTK